MDRFPRIVGKLVGAIVGWLLTRHPLGLLAGVALGHALDEGWLRLPGPGSRGAPDGRGGLGRPGGMGGQGGATGHTSSGRRDSGDPGGDDPGSASADTPNGGSSNEDDERLRRAVADLESSDPYRVLQVRRSASDAEVSAARRAALARYHPDRVAASADEIRALAERRAKAINAAYQAIMKSRGRP